MNAPLGADRRPEGFGCLFGPGHAVWNGSNVNTDENSDASCAIITGPAWCVRASGQLFVVKYVRVWVQEQKKNVRLMFLK